MEYKPTQEDIVFAKQVYDTIIFTQVLNPFAVKEAFRKLFGYDAQNAQQAKIKVSAYFIYQYKAVDVTETALPKNGESDTLSISNDNQSHSECPTHGVIPDEFLDLDSVGRTKEQLLMTDLEVLEANYAEATNANEKRSLKMKINKLKKNGSK